MTVALEDIPTLTINHPADRCDRCGSEAFFLAVKADLSLYFCGHHGKKYLDKLTHQDWQIVDDYEKINESPSISANAVD